MSENINEHDITKKMINTIAGGSGLIATIGKTIYLKEEEDDTFELTGQDMKDQEEAFREQLGSRVEFGPFYIKPFANNAEFSGKFLDNGLEWMFSLNEENGLYVTMNEVQVTEGVVERIRLLKAFYDNWQDEWDKKMSNEYKKQI